MTKNETTPVYDEVLDTALAQAVASGDNNAGDRLIAMDERTTPLALEGER